MRKNRSEIQAELNYWESEELLDEQIMAIPAQHGHSWMHRFMANGAGFYLSLPGEPSLYISGDTVFTDDVRRALTELKPDIAVVAAGSASLDAGGSILMTMKEIIDFIRLSPTA
jgi:L-ascorbate metabolism protein UlaG (beta-lactamase superfamily)